jgi:H+/Cl- antiporter ClcA
MIIGLVASVIAYFVESLVYGYIERTMLSGLEMLKIIPFGEINLMVFLQFLAVGIITGVIGSLISLGKYLKS